MLVIILTSTLDTSISQGKMHYKLKLFKWSLMLSYSACNGSSVFRRLHSIGRESDNHNFQSIHSWSTTASDRLVAMDQTFAALVSRLPPVFQSRSLASASNIRKTKIAIIITIIKHEPYKSDSVSVVAAKVWFPVSQQTLPTATNLLLDGLFRYVPSVIFWQKL